MSRLQEAKTSNTQEWQRLKNWCDGHLGQNIGETYQYLDWYEYTLNYALAYRLTGNNAYGNEGVKYLKALLRDESAIGDGHGGTNAIQTDAGYVSRSLGVGVAQGRDWLDGAPDLTPAIIQECTTRMGEWYNWIHKPGGTYGLDNPLNNYHAGHFAMTYSAAIAFEGDPGYSSAWMTKAEAMWGPMRDTFNLQLQGGDWAEGYNYGPRAIRHVLGYPWALETGTTLPNHWNEIDYNGQFCRAQVSLLHPSRAYFSDDGRWSGDTKGDPRSTTMRMVSVLSDTDATGKGLARWFSNHLVDEVGGPSEWEDMLFTDRNIAEITPTAANVGGLTWHGWGHATARGADWSNLDATFVDMTAWPDGAEEANFGELKIASRRQPLLVDGQTYQLESEFANVPRIEGTHTYAPYQEYWHDTAAMTVDSLDSVYTYFKVNGLEHGYDGVNNDDPSASYFRRDVVFLAPDHVVCFDNITVPQLSHTITEQWHVMGNPTLSGGDTATVTQGTARMFMRTVNPAASLSKTDTGASRDGTFRLDVAPITPQFTNKIVTLFETAGSAQAAMTPTQLMNPTGFTGVYVQNAAAPKIVLFATAQNAALTNASFSFTPAGANATRVVLIGMQPNTAFHVTTSSGAGGSVNVAVAPGSGSTSAANGSLTFTAAAPAAAVAEWSQY